METILVICKQNKIIWGVYRKDSPDTEAVEVASGTDLLTSTNGDYDSLLSNVVNHCHDLTVTGDVDFIFRRS